VQQIKQMNEKWLGNGWEMVEKNAEA